MDVQSLDSLVESGDFEAVEDASCFDSLPASFFCSSDFFSRQYYIPFTEFEDLGKDPDRTAICRRVLRANSDFFRASPAAGSSGPDSRDERTPPAKLAPTAATTPPAATHHTARRP